MCQDEYPFSHDEFELYLLNNWFYFNSGFEISCTREQKLYFRSDHTRGFLSFPSLMFLLIGLRPSFVQEVMRNLSKVQGRKKKEKYFLKIVRNECAAEGEQLWRIMLLWTTMIFLCSQDYRNPFKAALHRFGNIGSPTDTRILFSCVKKNRSCP